MLCLFVVWLQTRACQSRWARLDNCTFLGWTPGCRRGQRIQIPDLDGAGWVCPHVTKQVDIGRWH